MKPEELKALKDKVKQALDVDRHTLVMKFPFIGGISLKMNLIPTRDAMNPTACTDGKNIYFDCAFYTDLQPKERVFVLGHEIWHCVMLHLARRQTRDPALFNIATDMEVNHLLRLNAKDGILVPPSSVLFPPRELEGKSAEDIYDWLLKQAKNMMNKNGNQNQQNGGGSSQQSGGSGKSGKSKKSKSGGFDPNQSYDDQCDDSDEGNGGNSKDDIVKKIAEAMSRGSGGDSGSGKLKGQFDKHKYAGDEDEKSNSDGDSDGDGDGKNGKSQSKGPTRKDKYGEVGRDEDFNPSVSDDFAEEMRETVIAQAQQCQRTAGALPVGIESLLDKLDKPEIRWQELLSQFVTSCYAGKRRWLPPSRRHVYNEMYFQSRRDEKIKVAVAIDTSGSCLGDLPKFFGELTSLLKSFGQYELTVLQCDAAVDQVDKYDDTMPFPEEPKEIKWSGGGGTAFGPPFKWVEENRPDIDCFIYFTDGEEYASSESSVTRILPPAYPVLWILTCDGNEDVCDWGQKVRFKNPANLDGEW
jgi:predicted metal-dependent peptidase